MNDSKPRSQPPKPISQPPPAMDEFDDDWTDSEPDVENRDSIPLVTKKAKPDAAGSPVADGDSKPTTIKSEPPAVAAAKPEPAKSEPKPAAAAMREPRKTDSKETSPPSSHPAPTGKKPESAKAETKPADKPSGARETKPKSEAAQGGEQSGEQDVAKSEPPPSSRDSLDRELSLLSQPASAAQEASPTSSEWPRADAEPVQLGQALTLEVLFGRWTTSLRTVFLCSVGLSAVLVGLAVFAVVRSAENASSAKRPVEVQPTASASAAAAGSASASAAPSAQPGGQDLLSLARAGDKEAIETLDAKPAIARSAAEAAALVRGREVRRQRELEKLGEDLLVLPVLQHDHHAWRTLYEFVQDSRTATDALLIVSKLPGPAGPDLLYNVWTGTRARTDASGLAQELLYGPDVRPKASKALSVALDLRSAKECEQYKSILPRAIEHGDRRSLRLLGRLLKKRGCGRKNLEDCYKCLRKGKQLTKAIRAVKRHDEPSFQPEPEDEEPSDEARRKRGRRAPVVGGAGSRREVDSAQPAPPTGEDARRPPQP